MALDGTYDGLKASIADWLMRDDLTNTIPDFIKLCESRNNRRLRVREMEITATLATEAEFNSDFNEDFLNSVFGQLPADFLEARRVAANVDPVSVLSPVSMEMARTSFNTPGYPLRFVIQGNTLTAYPTTTATITIDYWAKIPTLSASTQTNWLLTKAPEIYLYGSLIESAPFMEDDNRLATWISLYKAAVDELQQADTRAIGITRAVARIRGVTP